MSTDDQVDNSLTQSVDDLAGLSLRLESGQHLHGDREANVALGEGPLALFDQQRLGTSTATCLPS